MYINCQMGWNMALITVFISGGFDLFHSGHLHLLTEARKLGDRLIVAINFDSYFAKKGPRRPVDTLSVRMENVLKTGLVDWVYPIEDSPLDLILDHAPDIIVTGDDYEESQIVGFNECAAWGGRVARIKRLPGISTTKLISDDVLIREVQRTGGIGQSLLHDN